MEGLASVWPPSRTKVGGVSLGDVWECDALPTDQPNSNLQPFHKLSQWLTYSIVDPLTGRERPIVGLQVPYAAAIATGTLPRIWLGQWDMVQRLHKIPNTVTEFGAYSLEWDLLAGNFGRAEPYLASGDAQVRNITVPWAAGHTGVVFAKPLALNPKTRAWINDYVPSPELTPLPTDAGVNLANLVHSADIWYSVKKHWCIEAQRLIRAERQAHAAQQ